MIPNDQRGKASTWLIFALLTASIYFGGQVIPYYYNYYELKNFVEAQAAKASVFRDSEIQSNIKDKLKELNVVLTSSEDFRLYRSLDTLYIKIQYSELFVFDVGIDKLYYEKEFNFKIDVKQETSRRSSQ